MAVGDQRAGTVSVSDVVTKEGDVGEHLMNFTVTRTDGTTPFDVKYLITGLTADAIDFTGTSGSLSFADGESTKDISIAVKGDIIYEPDEVLYVDLYDPTGGAALTKSHGIGIIQNDDPQSFVSIDDVTIDEGNDGIKQAVFTVTRAGSVQPISVKYTTNYSFGPSGQLDFAAGENTKTISLPVYGNYRVEPDRMFNVDLQAATQGTVLSKSRGVLTIRNDDAPPTLSISNPTVKEGDFGVTYATFTLTVGGIGSFLARYMTVDDTATAARGDYADSAAYIQLASGQPKDVAVRVNGDKVPSADKRFFLDVFAPPDVILLNGGRGVATILNDDQGPPINRFDPDGSPLVNDSFYNARYPDVAASGIDPDTHYATFGWREGRDPNAYFSTEGYLAANPDVRAAGIDPLQHYDQFGWREGRNPSADFDTERYLEHNPDVKAAGINPLTHYLQYGQAEGRAVYPVIGSATDIALHPGFDPEFYLLGNSDVAAAALVSGGDTYEYAYRHYANTGWKEGRDPNAIFDDNGYLNAYYGLDRSLEILGINPLTHYLQFGAKEIKDPSKEFDTKGYLVTNPDVAAANFNPMLHYLEFGAAEGRATQGDDSFNDRSIYRIHGIS